MKKSIIISFLFLAFFTGCYTNDYSSITKEYNEKNIYRIGKNIELAKLNQVDRQGYTMLAWAVFWNNHQTANHLIQEGARVDYNLKNGINLWNLAINMRIIRQRIEGNEIGSLKPGYDVEFPKLDVVKTLHEVGNLSLSKADSQGNTPLHLASSVALFSGDYSIVAYLMSSGADATLVNLEQQTPLQYALSTIEEIKKDPETYAYADAEKMESFVEGLTQILKPSA